tara:strand:- start:947 stop:2404 length:1458 start_codon:yes stop_codon:yes gene_type:complete
MATLAGSTIASSYPLLLKIDSTGIDSTLRKVEDGDATDSSLYLSTTSIGIDSTDKFYLDADQGTPHTYLHQVSADKLDIVVGGQTILEIDENGGGASDWVAIQAANKLFFDGGSDTYIQESSADTLDFYAGGVRFLTFTESSSDVFIVNEGGADIDFRVESSGEDEAIFLNAGSNHLDINKGETAFTTTIHNVDGEAVSVTATEVVVNDDGISTVDFRVESDNEDEALFIDASDDVLYINKGETAFTTNIYSTNDIAMTIGASGTIFNEDGHSTNDFRVESNTKTHMLFVDSGNDKLGINTSTLSAVLHITSVGSDSTRTIKVTDTDGSTSSSNIMMDMDYNADVDLNAAIFIQFQDGGGVIGSISGDNDATTYSTSSDYRLKTDLKDISNATENIEKLKLYDFAWKSNTNKRLTGVLAHEAKEIVPYAVIGEKDAMTKKEYEEDGEIKTKDVISPQSVDYSKFVPLLLKSIQELSNRIKVLEAK